MYWEIVGHFWDTLYRSNTVRKSRNISGQNRSPIFWYVVLIMFRTYGKRIKILYGCPFEGWPNRAWPSHPFWQLLVEWPCPVRSALKRTPVQDFNSFSIMFYNIISTTYQKIGDLFCPANISGLSHSVSKRKMMMMLNFFPFALKSTGLGSFFWINSNVSNVYMIMKSMHFQQVFLQI